MELMAKLNEAADYIKGKSKYKPEIAIILGSGLGAIADKIEEAESYLYTDIPHFPVSTVQGHEGRLVKIGRAHV